MALYVVGSPIGNLKDITLRALETLKQADLIYCEDTRRTSQLLAAYDIHKPLESLHHHSSQAKLDRTIELLAAGKDIAYLSDAGTPGIADPGGKLVALCHQHQIAVIPIPGPSAISALLSVAGVPADQFYFAGFVPTKKGRQTFIKKLLEYQQTQVLFETAPRIVKFLMQLIDLGGEDFQLVIGRELTKHFEQILTGSPLELLAYFQHQAPKGEFVIVLTSKSAQE